MSDRNKTDRGSLSASKPVPMPEYRYQSGWGNSGSVSSNNTRGADRKFAELRNFVPDRD